MYLPATELAKPSRMEGASLFQERNGMDLTEAEDIKKRWQENTAELHKKDLHDPNSHDGMITHLESDNLECEDTWA